MESNCFAGEGTPEWWINVNFWQSHTWRAFWMPSVPTWGVTRALEINHLRHLWGMSTTLSGCCNYSDSAGWDSPLDSLLLNWCDRSIPLANFLYSSYIHTCLIIKGNTGMVLWHFLYIEHRQVIVHFVLYSAVQCFVCWAYSLKSFVSCFFMWLDLISIAPDYQSKCRQMGWLIERKGNAVSLNDKPSNKLTLNGLLSDREREKVRKNEEWDEKDEGRPFAKAGEERREEKTDKTATEGGNTCLDMNNRLLSTLNSLHPSASFASWRTCAQLLRQQHHCHIESRIGGTLRAASKHTWSTPVGDYKVQMRCKQHIKDCNI